MKITIKKIVELLPFSILGSAVFFNLGGKLFGLWSQPVLVITLAFLIIVPFLSFILLKVWSGTRQSFLDIPLKRRWTLAIFSLTPAIILAIAFPPQFSSSILISPEISGNQQVVLLEMKADGHVIPVENVAVDYGWQVEEDGIYANANSRPLLVQMRTRVAALVSLIFRTSSNSGLVLIRHNRQEEQINLISETVGQTLFTFRTNFRGSPNWIFLPLVYGADILAYSLYALVIFILQDRGQQAMAQRDLEEKFLSHRSGLIILIALAGILHVINALAVPLIFGADSPSFIRGAFHLVNEGDFGGVAQIRGPGTTLLFAPIAALFGRNPWGIKIFLHLMALALVPLSYRISWQLSGKRNVAFLTGLAAALMPDLYFFSNFMMSDLPNLVIVSTFTTLLISALQTGRKKWIFGAMLIASFGVLLRSENLALLALSAFVLSAQPIWDWIIREKRINLQRNFTSRILTVGLVLLIALLPVLWWSWHNYHEYGVFGMGNYGGEVFYTGWIYYAEGSGYSFADPNSHAVQAIQTAIDEYPIERINQAGVPTGWNLYPSLIKAGFSQAEAFDLMTQATWDSIQANPRMAREVLTVKLLDGLTPVPTQMKTFHLPGEEPPDETLKSVFFDSETLRIPFIIQLQRSFYQIPQFFYAHIYPLLVWAGLAAVYFSLLKKPELIWWSVATIALSRIFIPDIMGKADWRYTLAGMVLVQVVTIQWLSSTICGIVKPFSSEKKSPENA
jgi:hypothetical protein